MARQREFDYGEVVRIARDLFWERGYASTSLSQLLAATGLSKSTLYQTFGNKRGLFGVAIADYLDDVMSPLIAPMEAENAGKDELITFFRAIGERIRALPRGEAHRGCLMVNTFSDLEDLDDAARDISLRYRNRIRDAILHIVSGMPDTVRDPLGTAELLTAGKIGLMVTARVDPERAIMVAETIAADIANWSPLRPI